MFQMERYSPCVSQIVPFLLATIATPIDSAHSMHDAYRPCALCSCTQLSADNELVKIVEIMVFNAHGISGSLADITGDPSNQPLFIGIGRY